MFQDDQMLQGPAVPAKEATGRGWDGVVHQHEGPCRSRVTRHEVIERQQTRTVPRLVYHITEATGLTDAPDAAVVPPKGSTRPRLGPMGQAFGVENVW